MKAAVDSVFRQTFRDWELLIVDDNSKDEEIYTFLNELNAMNENVHVHLTQLEDDFRSKHKMVSVMINIGLHYAAGTYITYLCDDDTFFPDRCEKMVNILDDWNHRGAVVCNVRWLTKDGRRKGQDTVKYNYPKPYEHGHQELLEMIAPSNFICHDCIMHRKTDMRWPEVDEDTPVDWRHWCAMANAGIKFRKLAWTGAEAFFPGSWREGMTLQEALNAKGITGGETMEKVQYAKNTGGKIEILDGGEVEVFPGDVIDAKKVTTPKGKLLPGFEYDRILRVPSIGLQQSVEGDEKDVEPEMVFPLAPKTETVVDGPKKLSKSIVTKKENLKKKFPFMQSHHDEVPSTYVQPEEEKKEETEVVETDDLTSRVDPIEGRIACKGGCGRSVSTSGKTGYCKECYPKFKRGDLNGDETTGECRGD